MKLSILINLSPEPMMIKKSESEYFRLTNMTTQKLYPHQTLKMYLSCEFPTGLITKAKKLLYA